MPSQQQIRQDITSRIVEALESSLLPWRRPWSVSSNAGRPANVVSKRPYSGVNPLLLELHRLRHGLQSKWWGTFRQWSDAGCTVKKRPQGVKSGQWGCHIVFCKRVERTVEKDGDEVDESFFLLHTFTVFNADQVEGEYAERLQVKEETPTDIVLNFEPAEELIAATGADIRHGGESAFYRRPTPVTAWPNHDGGDFIVVPHRYRFDPIGSYYETLLHELAHWSEVRLRWTGTYAMGELIAEMASSFLATELGVPQAESLENHAAYLKSWLGAMKDDPSFIFKASTQASKVADFLRSFIAESSTVSPEPVGV